MNQNLVMCDKCGLMFKNGHSIGSHHRYCEGKEKIEEIKKLISEGHSKRSLEKLGYPRQILYHILKGENVPKTKSKDAIENENIFENIDTKDKAYWLGFLYADGFIGRDGHFVRLIISVKDLLHLNKFIEFVGGKKDNIKIYGPYLYPNGIKAGKVAHYTIRSDKIVSDLIRYGCVTNKSKAIRLPELNNEELNLSFLLGYYDGDGSQKNPNLCSGSKEFLNDICKKYKLNSNVKERKTVCSLYLGVDLYKKMVLNYKDSLVRKRTLHDKGCLACGKDIWSTSIYCNACMGVVRRKIKRPSKEELENLMKLNTWRQLGEKFGVTDSCVRKWAKEYDLVWITRKQEVSQMYDLYLKGHTVEEISKIFNIEKKSVQYRLRKNFGVNFENRTIDRTKVVELIKKGLSPYGIKKEMKCSNIIYKIIKTVREDLLGVNVQGDGGLAEDRTRDLLIKS